MAKTYKELNEGRYTTLHDYTKLSVLEKIYFSISPTTIVLRRLLSLLDSYVTEQKKNHLKILDVGCGGGIKDLTLRGEVYGLDISESSLRQCQKIYKQAKTVDLSKRYPFPDNTFDIVFCSEVYGHIAYKDKDRFLDEVQRVLKKGGFFVFSCETDGDNWLTRYLRKHNLYKKYWVDFDGHIGLETPKKTLERFRERFPQVNYKVNNTYIFTIDELITIFPSIASLFRGTMSRRLANLIIAPFYELSLRLARLSSANNICVYGKK